MLKSIILVLTLITIGVSTTAMGQDNPHNRQPNHLEGIGSPYLQQHLYNAVDWYPWGEEALNKARNEDKPIFLSIGYSTCHWCHVMAEESFENQQIGDFLNEHFVSIKIDRERRPDLDEQFMLVTQVISGNGGWPNSIFLTSEGEPFYAGTYFPPEPFLDLLDQINGLWRTQRNNVTAEGQRIGDTIRTYMRRSAAAMDLTPQAISAAADSLTENIDVFYGGFGVAPKFPRESNLLFLLDQAERRADPALLGIVTDALDGMLKGGIHDHVGGGFHRYSVDEAWQIPHFEKMLYNQALIGRLLVHAFVATGQYRYKRAAMRTFDYVLREMRDPQGGFYSAQDADSLAPDGSKIEGYFYAWKPEDLSSLLAENADFTIAALNVTDEGNFSHGSLNNATVLHMNTLPVTDEEAYYARLDAALDILLQARNMRPDPHRDEKIVVDWNAMMIETLAEAASVFERPDYYQAATQSASFITRNMLTHDGLSRVSFEGSTGVVAQLSDYAGLGLALLALYDYAPSGIDKTTLLNQAMEISAQLTSRFANDNLEDATYRMTAIPEGLGIFMPLDDSEIPAGNALTLALLDGLAKRTGEPGYAQKARLLAAALSGHALGSPASRAYTLRTALALSHGETGPTRYLANGVIKISSVLDREQQIISFNIEIAQGWHINANKPLEDYLIPTELDLFGTPINDAAYPEPLTKSLGFSSQPLALYEGILQLSSSQPVGPRSEPGIATLKLQACSDQVCLAPEEAIFTLW